MPRARSVHVRLGAANSASASRLDLDADALVARWRAGAALSQLAREVAEANPGANAVLVSLALCQLIDDAIARK